MANAVETEEERSIKDLFTQRIVKGRPDLFVASTPIPTSPSSPQTSPTTPSQTFEVLQSNITGFFSQFAKQQQSEKKEEGSEKLREFNKRWSRNDSK